MVKLNVPSVAEVAVSPVETKLLWLRDHTNSVTASPATPLRSAVSLPLIVSVWCLACATTLLFRCRNVASVFGPLPAALAAPADSRTLTAARAATAAAEASRAGSDTRMRSPSVRAAARQAAGDHLLQRHQPGCLLLIRTVERLLVASGPQEASVTGAFSSSATMAGQSPPGSS